MARKTRSLVKGVRVTSGKVFEARLQVDVDVLVRMEYDRTVTSEDAYKSGRALSFDERAIQRAIDEGRAKVRVLNGSARLIGVSQKDVNIDG
jgi:hypothetical protein